MQTETASKQTQERGESLIEHACRSLGTSNRDMLRYPPHLVSFLELLLDEEAVNSFSIAQYRFAANFIAGRRVEISDEKLLDYLENIMLALLRSRAALGRRAQNTG